MTIEPSVDYLYWFGGGSSVANAEIGLLWGELFPLGQACWIIEQWNSKKQNENQKRISVNRVMNNCDLEGNGVKRQEVEMKLMELSVMIEQCKEKEVKNSFRQGGKQLTSNKSQRPRSHFEEQRGRDNTKVDNLLHLTELWTVEGIRIVESDINMGRPYEGGRCDSKAGMSRTYEGGKYDSETYISRPIGTIGYGSEAVGDAERLGLLAAKAKLAAGLLQGRALLSGEARALLEGATVPDTKESWNGVIQLASLLGHVCLSGSVAADWGGRPGTLRCLRCGSGEEHMRRTRCASCGRMCAYCEACLTMGRSRECELLIRGLHNSEHTMNGISAKGDLSGYNASINERLGKWGLSPAQQFAAAVALQFVETAPKYRNVGGRESVKGTRAPLQGEHCRMPEEVHLHVQQEVQRQTCKRLKGKRELFYNPIRSNHFLQQLHLLTHYGKRIWRGANKLLDTLSHGIKRIGGRKGHFGERSDIRSFLLWAVTGAGKTEMIFPLVDSVISKGGRVLIASPRRDVVIELDPRIRRAFPKKSVVTLYGGSDQRWERGDITLSTTHQLFRFHEAFDLVIVDEIDAFPFHPQCTLLTVLVVCHSLNLKRKRPTFP